MKTYKTTQTKPCLEIRYDEYALSPREAFGCVGHFFTCDSRKTSPDDTDHPLYDTIARTQYDAMNTEEHRQLIIEEWNTENPDNTIIAIYPITKHEHGNIKYTRSVGSGFDCSTNGFYVVTEQSKRIEATPEELAELVDDELELWNNYVNGDVFRFELFNDRGEIVDSCSGFYDIEDIREHLPEEYQEEDLNKYLII